jgi:hypothetical protein
VDRPARTGTLGPRLAFNGAWLIDQLAAANGGLEFRRPIVSSFTFDKSPWTTVSVLS